MKVPGTIMVVVAVRQIRPLCAVRFSLAFHNTRGKINYTMIYKLSLLLFLMLQPVVSMGNNTEENYNPICQESVVPATDIWDGLLNKYVDSDGNVDYEGLAKERSVLDDYLVSLGSNPPAEEASKEEKLVYYINLYNAATVKLILAHYPINSIKDIKSPWGKKWIMVGDQNISLGDIEHKILRKLGEPRIHFAINCASYSCPKLIPEAYTLENLENQLEFAAQEFINDPKRNRISIDNAEVSEIFRWFKSDFTGNGSIKDYINSYSKIPISTGTRLSYIKYDWSLNEKK